MTHMTLFFKNKRTFFKARSQHHDIHPSPVSSSSRLPSHQSRPLHRQETSKTPDATSRRHLISDLPQLLTLPGATGRLTLLILLPSHQFKGMGILFCKLQESDKFVAKKIVVCD
ncbi:hypothetical protein M9H77_07290 [Catharanthus roseus]|uniref:Uncharacterized protein n=1 Tax=Catharanthus roseus TaxID=4058 RepID=A0ACC0BUH6_CATRO|nr:hypothetical protein M9H77_07290 [Catharanthus roseus]